jgi:hypothetical protein
MNSIKTSIDKPYEFSLLIHGTKLAETIANFFISDNTICKRSRSVDIIFLECAWVDTMKKILNLGNSLILQNFGLCLILEDGYKNKRS